MLNFRDRLPPDKVEYFAKAIIPACTKISNLRLGLLVDVWQLHTPIDVDVAAQVLEPCGHCAAQHQAGGDVALEVPRRHGLFHVL